MLPDGEYEIDLLVLGLDQSASATPMALRYGFVPDSMSQSAPLKLYRDETTCVLEAQSTSRKAASSVIFEVYSSGRGLETPVMVIRSTCPFVRGCWESKCCYSSFLTQSG